MATGDPYADTSQIGLSLWFVAAEPVERELKGLIERTAMHHKSDPASTNFPIFHPHITVSFWSKSMPAERIDQAARDLAASMSPFNASFARATAGSIYFQCVYALCEKTQPLMEANAAIQQRFDMNYAYMPHMSLAYGDLTTEAKEVLVTELAPHIDGRAVPIDRMEVWDTSGPVERWSLVKSYPLTGKARGEVQ